MSIVRVDRPTPQLLVPTLLAVLFACVFLVSFLQKESGMFFSKTVSLETQIAKGSSRDHALLVTIPRKYVSAVTIERAVVLEDGEPLAIRADSNREVREKGRGRYRLGKNRIYLSSRDNSDPKTNGMRYDLLVPYPVNPLVLWGSLIAFTACFGFTLRSGSKNLHCPLPHRLQTVFVWALLFGAMIWCLFAKSGYSDGWFLISGLPFSDARGWLELAESLSEGRGFTGSFEAHRGGYPLVLGSAFAIFGDSLFIAKLFNAALLSFAGTYLYLLARDAFGQIVALGLVAMLLFGQPFLLLVHYTMTEPTGFGLGAIGIYFVYKAAVTGKPNAFLLGGIFLALSNITRPFTLVALPAIGLVLLVAAMIGRWGIKPFIWRTVLFVGGALIVFAPWVLRQKTAWDVATLDLNSAVMLYGAAAEAPEGRPRTLGARHYEEAIAAGVPRADRGQSYHYFLKRYRETVSADPSNYWRYVGQCFIDFFKTPGFDNVHLRGMLGLVFFFALVSLAAHLRFAPLVLLSGFWPLLGDALVAPHAAIVLLLAALIAFFGHEVRGRFAVALLVVTLVGAGILNAMVGNFGLNRGSVFVESIVFLLLAAAFSAGARLLSKLSKKRSEIKVAVPDEPKVAAAAPIGLLSFLLVGLIVVAAKHVVAKPPSQDGWRLSESNRSALLTAAADRTKSIPANLLFTGIVQLGPYRWHIPANRDVGHDLRFFEVRSFDRTAISAESGFDPDTGSKRIVNLNIPGNAMNQKAEQRYAIAGFRNIDESALLGFSKEIVEVLLIAPIDPKSGNIDFSRAQDFQLPDDLRLGESVN